MCTACSPICIHCASLNAQVHDLEATIEAVPAETVIIATPMNLEHVIKINKPTVIVSHTILKNHFSMQIALSGCTGLSSQARQALTCPDLQLLLVLQLGPLLLLLYACRVVTSYSSPLLLHL